MGVKERLLHDAESFATEVRTLDEEGFISRTLAALGLPDDSVTGQETKETSTRSGPGRTPAAGPGRGRPPAIS